jgi:excisionase family DNA binding protein
MSKNKITSGERTLITCQDAAKLYGCTMGYIRRLARDGRVFGQLIGRTYLVDAAEVKKLAASGGKLAKGFAAN